MNGNKKLNAIYILIQSFYWMTGCALICFAAVFLGDIGLTESAIGSICAFGSVGGFVFMTLGALYIDSSPRALFRMIRVIQGAVIVLSIILATAAKMQILCAVAYSLGIALVQTLPPVYNTLYTSLRSNGDNINYGAARGLGSLMFSCSSAAVGLLIGKLGSFIVPLIVPLLLMPQIIGTEYLGRHLKGSCGKAGGAGLDRNGIVPFIKRHPGYMWFCIGVGILMAVNRVFSTFMNLLCRECGGDVAATGAMLGYMALLEVPVIMFFSKLRERFSLKKLVTVSFVFYTLKAATMTFATSIPALVAAATLHVISSGLLTPAGIIYVSEIIGPEEAGKGQSLYAAVPVLLSGIIVMASGFLFDTFSVHTGLVIMTGLSALGCVIGIASLRKKE